MILIKLINKEVLQFFRNKSNVATMFIFPIVLIVVMGFSLNGLMNVDHNIFENEKVYFKVNTLNKDSILNIGGYKISIIDDAVRFDHITGEHYHFQCDKCKKLIDINLPYNKELDDAVSKKYNVEIDKHDIVFIGICKSCKSE